MAVSGGEAGTAPSRNRNMSFDRRATTTEAPTSASVRMQPPRATAIFRRGTIDPHHSTAAWAQSAAEHHPRQTGMNHPHATDPCCSTVVGMLRFAVIGVAADLMLGLVRAEIRLVQAS